MDELISDKEFYIKLIKEGRRNVAKLKHDKALAKAPLWEDATGTVDQKKDYIKSEIATFDRDIAVEEANIEYAYNMIDVINDKVMLNE